MTISQKSTDVRGRQRQGKPGQWAESNSTDEYFTGLNQSPQAPQITTVTLADPGDDKSIIITINGFDVEIETGTGGDAASLGADLAEAINLDQRVRGQVKATFATTTLTLTGLTPTLSFTVSIANDPETALSSVSTTQAAAAAEAIPFGRCVIRQTPNTYEGEPIVALAKSSLFTAQVITETITYVDTAVIEIRVYEVRGDERILIADVSEASASTRDATLDALVVLLNAALPADSVIAAADNATATAIVFTAEVAGLEFDVEVFPGHEGASLPAVTKALTTGPSRATSLHRALAGVSLYSHMDPAPSGSDDGEYAANAGVLVANRGKVFVESSQTISPGETAYIELGVTADNGKVFNSDSSTRIGLARRFVQWDSDGIQSGDSVAVARFTL